MAREPIEVALVLYVSCIISFLPFSREKTVWLEDWQECIVWQSVIAVPLSPLPLFPQVLYLQAFLLVWLLATLAKKIFFGSLRAAEIEVRLRLALVKYSTHYLYSCCSQPFLLPSFPLQHLIEKSWFAVLETFILLAAFHQELSVGFVTMVTALFMFKAFHWLAGDRIDYVRINTLYTTNYIQGA